MKYYEVFGEPGYHSAFLTTFSFSAQAFEGIAFSKLRGAGCRNVVVLADETMANIDATDFGVPRFAGTLYHLAKVNVAGAFHPKVTLLLGKEKGRLLVGSANLTALGIAGNRELIADLRYTVDEPALVSVFRQAFDYACSHAPPGDPWLPVARDRALQLSPWLQGSEDAGEPGDTGGVRLLHEKPDKSILEQLVEATGGDEIERLVVMSPYWDKKLEALSRLRAALGEPPVDVLIEESRGEFPGPRLAQASGIELFDIESEGGSRFNHAKLIVARGRAWDHVISGSMNCSSPALLADGTRPGNAEAGVYKRVERGTALDTLGLDEYRDVPLDPTSLTTIVTGENESEVKGLTSPGSFVLRGDVFEWSEPARHGERPTHLELFDGTGGSPWGRLPIDDVSKTTWHLDLALGRPRSAKLHLANGEVSSLAVVVDWDHLHSATLPASGGKRAKLTDRLFGTTSEDLALVGIIGDLEALDLDELGQVSNSFRAGKATPDTKENTGNHQPLSYEDFVEARKRAEARGEAFRSSSVNRGTRAADLVSSCLNRLIGLVSEDKTVQEEMDLEAASNVDLSSTEPSSDVEVAEPAPIASASEEALEKSEKKKARLRASKVLEAVVAFEARSKALREKTVTTAELVRLRALLQVILAYAKPLEPREGEHGVLPAAENSGHDWPRLIGRLLNQHFGTAIALQGIDLEEDENEQLRVIEYLATVHYAGHAARQVVKAHPKAAVLSPPMEKIARNISTQLEPVLEHRAEDRAYFDELVGKLERRFSDRLGIAPVQPSPSAAAG